MKHARDAEYVIRVHMRDQYSHFPVEAQLCEEELLLSSFSAVEHDEASICSDSKAWEISLLGRYAASGA
jgi:hypothetical protein